MTTDLEVKKPFSLSEIYDNETVIEIAKIEQLNSILCSKPNMNWVKTHPYISNYKYLPIDKVEFLLRKIFKRYKIEITGNGQAFNGVWMTVRVHYVDPITKEWMFYDGVGAEELQLRAKTKDEKDMEIASGQKFRVPFSTENINTGAIKMAYPLAKTTAVKDACDHFGDIFGANLNRKDTVDFYIDKNIIDNAEKAKEIFSKIIDNE